MVSFAETNEVIAERISLTAFQILSATSRVISLEFPRKICDAINLSVNTAWQLCIELSHIRMLDKFFFFECIHCRTIANTCKYGVGLLQRKGTLKSLVTLNLVWPEQRRLTNLNRMNLLYPVNLKVILSSSWEPIMWGLQCGTWVVSTWFQRI